MSAKRHHDEQPAQGEDWAKELDQAADGLMSSFVDMIKGMFGSANDDQPEAKTVAELAAQAPANVSILINAVNRADLQKVIADPNLEATIFVPTNQVRGGACGPRDECSNVMLSRLALEQLLQCVDTPSVGGLPQLQSQHCRADR